MSIWGKLKFWGSKEPELGKYPDLPQMPGEPGPFPQDFNPASPSYGMGQMNPGPGMQGMNTSIGQDYRVQQQQYPTFEPVPQNTIPRNVSFPGSSVQQPEYSGSAGKDMNMEVISAKLDALRASLESVNQRLANLERAAYGDFEQKRGPRW